eukprot:TRINITY_DN2257_c1_g2_i2.p1 TRINITY_DN2257_c1_g2~~TRINITY_DN2257_c1_g2_i2.p1  ORF type:complete len:635 (-),score=31.63 TRINITY_DN2257_c1_g2_i2:884-2788(-)
MGGVEYVPTLKPDSLAERFLAVSLEEHKIQREESQRLLTLELPEEFEGVSAADISESVESLSDAQCETDDDNAVDDAGVEATGAASNATGDDAAPDATGDDTAPDATGDDTAPDATGDDAASDDTGDDAAPLRATFSRTCRGASGGRRNHSDRQVKVAFVRDVQKNMKAILDDGEWGKLTEPEQRGYMKKARACWEAHVLQFRSKRVRIHHRGQIKLWAESIVKEEGQRGTKVKGHLRRKIRKYKKAPKYVLLDRLTHAWFRGKRESGAVVDRGDLLAKARELIAAHDDLRLETRDKPLSERWVEGFCRRHVIRRRRAVRKSCLTKEERSEKAQRFLTAVGQIHRLCDRAGCPINTILNFDEVPDSTCGSLRNAATLALAGDTEVRVNIDDACFKRTSTLVACGGMQKDTASGEWKPLRTEPLILLKGTPKQSRLRDAAWPAPVAWTPKGVINEATMLGVVVPWLKRQVGSQAGMTLLVMDSARSHLTRRVAAALKKENFMVAIIPAGMTSYMQVCPRMCVAVRYPLVCTTPPPYPFVAKTVGRPLLGRPVSGGQIQGLQDGSSGGEAFLAGEAAAVGAAERAGVGRGVWGVRRDAHEVRIRGPVAVRRVGDVQRRVRVQGTGVLVRSPGRGGR